MTIAIEEDRAQPAAPSEQGAARLICLGRSGRPPLRIRGRRLACHSGRHGTAVMSIALWACDAGGYAAELKLEDGPRREADALRGPDMDAAIGFAEASRLPLRPGSAPARARPAQSALGEARALAARSREAALAEAWRDLVGEALSDWTAQER